MNSVRLIAKTMPCIEELKTPNDIISYCARVSNPVNQLNTETSEKLIKYLLKNSHFSPFEMVNLVFEIKTTRDIARQILRHRSFSFQEFSQRYAEVNTDNFSIRETRLQDTKNRQSSFTTDDADLIAKWEGWQRHVISQVTEAYDWAIKAGIAKEQARAVLPEGMTPSVMLMQGSLRSWITYVALREGNGTQAEHQEIARLIRERLFKEFPVLNTLINSEGRVSL